MTTPGNRSYNSNRELRCEENATEEFSGILKKSMGFSHGPLWHSLIPQVKNKECFRGTPGKYRRKPLAKPLQKSSLDVNVLKGSHLWENIRYFLVRKGGNPGEMLLGRNGIQKEEKSLQQLFQDEGSSSCGNPRGKP